MRKFFRIKGLELFASLGIFDWEKCEKQKIRIDIEFCYASNKACQTDNIEDTCNYALVVEDAKKIVEAKHYQLVERLADQLIQELMETFNMTWISVYIQKFCIKEIESVGIYLEKGEKE